MPNLWQQFRQLLPDDPVLLVDVVAHNADGTSTVNLLDGTPLRVRGQGVATGNRAYIQSGQIQGEAPTLPVSDIEI